MRKAKFSLVLDQNQYDLIVVSLIELKNHLIQEDRYTDAVDETLLKVISAKKKVYRQ